MGILFGSHEFEAGQVVSDTTGARWIVLWYEFGLVKVRPEPDEAYKEYGAVLMPEYLLRKV